MNKEKSQELRIVLIQNNIVWQNIPKNLTRLDSTLDEIPRPFDLILLPEMFATGFTFKPDSIPGHEHQLIMPWMKRIASEYNTAIAGSHPFPEGDAFYNRLFFCDSTGSYGYYDKRHLFPMEGENIVYRPGSERKLFNLLGWKIFPLICYDLRFPVWSRNTENFDLLVYASNWPAARNSVWETLLKARAIENQCYVVGINRVGTDGNGIRYIGNSQIVSPLGEVICKLDESEGVMQVSLNKDSILKYRKKFPVLDDRDDFEIKN